MSKMMAAHAPSATLPTVDFSSVGSISDGDSVASDGGGGVPAESAPSRLRGSAPAGDDPEAGPDDDDRVADTIAKKDTKAACHLRVLVIALFVFMSVFVPVIIFLTARRNEETGFINEFEALATKVRDSFEFNVARKLGAIDSLDISITSYAVGTDSTFPFVTMPDFDLRAANTLALADTFSVFLVPIIAANSQQVLNGTHSVRELREDYERYAFERQDWIAKSFHRKTAVKRRLEDAAAEPVAPRGIRPRIFTQDETSEMRVDESTDGPFYPVWQNAPVFEDIVNFNLASVDTFRDGIEAMVASEQAVLGKVADFGPDERLVKEYLLKNDDPDSTSVDEPVSSMYYPVFDRFGKDHNLVALFTTIIFWHTFFEGILPGNAKGIVCVIENECGQSFTYQIDGQESTFIGYGDKHDRTYDERVKDYKINQVQQSDSFTFREASIPLNSDYCPYTLNIYPSDKLRNEYVTYRPALYTFCVALAFVLISAVAITYDCVVQRRLKTVLNSALESRAIVSSLFPANVRDRLFEQDDAAAANGDGAGPRKDKTLGDVGDELKKNHAHADGPPTATTTGAASSFGVSDHHLAAHPAKLRLKSFLHEGPKMGTPDANVLQTKPIADLFPHCTVLFADIAGFTAWSSEREPAQVFMLLQTIFHFFDNIARKWGVFKVETIGDCYVAVTGLPDPQPDHAIRMTKFARECLRKVTDLTHKLESSLGPDTGDLSMRFGLHSGPVTAGVLRGEKSRFQLFGDTVNTASRMESTGQKNNIQVSQSTADLLIEAGKESWITPRDDLVSAKGKGQIQTYWVTNKSRAGTSSNGVSDDSDERSSQVSGQDHQFANKSTVPTDAVESVNQNRKLKRLVDWQTDILARLLKLMVAQRDRKAAAGSGKFVTAPEDAFGKGCILDEVAETLVLPKFDPMAAKSQVNPNSIELSSAVMTQLRSYVATMASKYHDNPFHNFEHASHVTMSASKLLNRIVIPEDVNYQRKSVKAIASDLHDYTYGITSDPLTQFAVIFCALIHDADHAGVSNFQLASERPDMAEEFKNRGLAEQNSVIIAWDLLMSPEYKNLQQCIFTNDTELQRFRQLVVNLVMATDIFDKEMKTLRNSRWDKAFHRDPQAISLSESDTTNLKATIVIEHIIQAADVAHTMQHWHVYTKWNERLFQEMYLAYEMGRSAKDPSEGWYNGELWFFDNYVIPLAKKLDECNVFGVASDEGYNYALANRAEWAIKGGDIVKEMVQRYHERKGGNGATLGQAPGLPPV